MKHCRLPVAVICLLTVSFTAGWVAGAGQAAPLNRAHPEVIKIRVGTARPIKFALLRLKGAGRYDKILKSGLVLQ